MVFVVKCLICSELLKYERDNTAVLCEHIRTKHPKHRPLVETTKQKIEERYLKDIKGNTECFSRIINKSVQTDKMEKRTSIQSRNEFKTPHEDIIRNSESKEVKESKSGQKSKTIYKREYKQKKVLKADVPKKMTLYKTTIEKWRPGGDKITCPECGCTKRPVIRSHTDKISNSSFGAAMVLSCWPFCFLPWIFPIPTHEHLHCAMCNHYLGVYNHRNEKVTPNFQPPPPPDCPPECETALGPESDDKDNDCEPGPSGKG